MSAPAPAPAHHTPDDVRRLQQHLDDSYRRGGAHLLGIHTAAARLTAEQVVARLPGMHVMVVATVSADGRPFTGPVDGFLHAGRVLFGTADTALRARHLAVRPAVSVTFVEGEGMVFTVHGRARTLDLAGRDRGVAERLRAHYGPGWDDWGVGSTYVTVEPDRVLAADMRVHTGAA